MITRMKVVFFAFLMAVCTTCSSRAKTSNPEGGVLYRAISTRSDSLNYETMECNIKKLVSLFSQMVENSNSFSNGWKNIKLGPEAFAEMTEKLPLRVAGELTPYTRIILLNKMLECMPERDCPRFFLKVREYQESMFPLIQKKDIAEDMDIDQYEGAPADYVHNFTKADLEVLKQKTVDYLDLGMTMEQWCEKYECHLKFDEVERSPEWEKEIYDVEKTLAKKLEGVPHRMGYCFQYWHEKREVLARHGIDWCSPSVMNPDVMFD